MRFDSIAIKCDAFETLFLVLGERNETAKLFSNVIADYELNENIQVCSSFGSEDFIFKHEVSSESRNEIFLNSDKSGKM